MDSCPTRSVVLRRDGAAMLPKGDRLFAIPLDDSGHIVELDPVTGVEINRFVAPEPSILGSDGLAFDGTSLWFINSDGSDTLYQLHPDTGAVIDGDLITVGSGTYDGLAAVGGLIYIQDPDLNDIHVFDPGSDSISNTLPPS